jgi:iron(III) transport system substrate-binding protein
VLDDRAWRGGLDARFLDRDGILAFDWEHQVHHSYLVKTDQVGEGEIRTVDDLLAPKWQGKILSSDPRLGDALTAATAIAKSRGPDVLRRLLVDQRPAFISGNGWNSAAAIDFIRGPYSIAQSLRPKPLAEARAQGLADRVRYLDLPDADFVPSLALLCVAGAPHPTAARLFANWILTREGQTTLTSNLPTNSARTDVSPFEPDGVGALESTYYDPDGEANQPHAAETSRLVRELLSATR